jgi:hypothetical protein
MLDECQQLVRIVAPREFPDRLPLVIDMAELSHLPGNNDCHGWANDGSVFQLPFAERLGERYQRGDAVIALDIAGIKASAKHGHFRDCVFATMLHEIGHVVPRPTVRPDLPVPQKKLRDYQLRVMQWWEDKQKPDDPADVHHGALFIRRAIHLFVRAAEAGVSAFLDDVLGRSKWRSCGAMYLPLLLGEALQMRGASFAEIDQTPPPRLFILQWQADLEYCAILNDEQNGDSDNET